MRLADLVKVAIGAMALTLIGCSGGSETVDVPKSATEGGNVVKDPALREQMLGSSGAGGGGQQSSSLGQ